MENDDDDWETHGVGPSFWDSPTPGNEPSQDDLDSQIAQAQKDADDANQMAQQFGGMTQGGDSRYDDAAAEANTAIEVNANPARLDIDWRFLSYAQEKGVQIPINTDAHSTGGLEDMCYGVGIARKGGVTADGVLNALNLEDFLA